jgi:prepilin-type N-terminal cleavage/methylation domain-containing protein
MKRQRNGRAGFTLIELLTVLAIMGLLAAITASAVARYRMSAMEKQTDQSILKLDVGLQQQIKSITDKAKNEPIPDNINELARDGLPSNLNVPGQFDNARARALHMKLRLQQELPQTFDEARKIIPGYPRKESIVAAIGTTGNGANLPEEAAALLYLILSQGRGGQTFDVDGAAPVQVRTINGRQMKVFVDAWDNPIVFRRTVGDTEQPVRDELNNAPYVPANAPLGKRDPLDPNGRLTAPGANNWVPANRALALQALMNVFQADPFDGSNRGPYIMSAGRDGVYSNGSEDDQFSFRIQQYGKGN